MLKFGRTVTKHRKIILIIALIMVIPAAIGYMLTPVNYDILNYLPDNIDSTKGEAILSDEFGKSAFAMVMVEDMDYRDVSKLKTKIEDVDNVTDVIWYDTVADLSIPKEMLPDGLYEAFNNDETNTTLMAVFFSTHISEEATLNSISQMRKICGKQCFISGMSAFVLDLKNLGDNEEPKYVAIATVLAILFLSFLLDSWLLGIVFVIGIGITIIYNMGTNFIIGDVSYITKAIAAVLQLAVTMDYSIFLWHSYNEHLEEGYEREDAMSNAIAKTLTSITGSSVTTIAGFLALCFMTFTLGLNLGIIMAKGVLLGVIGSVTILPAILLGLEKPIRKTRHKPLMIKFDKMSGAILKRPVVFLIVFLVLLGPALYGYTHTQSYYKLDEGVPQDLPFAVANEKLSNDFDMNSTTMLLLDSAVSQKDVHNMMKELEKVEGVNNVLGIGSVLSPTVPEEIVPSELDNMLRSDKHQFLIISSEYSVASDEVNAQLIEMNRIVKKYDKTGMLIGEAAGTKDLIEISDHDFRAVTAVSVGAIFLIILLVLQSISLPFILVGCIELAIFINLGIPFYSGTLLSFIDSITISTIQLGATVDYAILMTNRYKRERLDGKDRHDAVYIAHTTSMPSVVVSALSFFAATVGVSFYSNIDIISSMCGLMARGAIISMFTVMFMIPAFLYLFDKFIIKTTRGLRGVIKW